MVTRILKSKTGSVKETIDLWIQGQLFQLRGHVFQVLLILAESMAIFLGVVLVGRGSSFRSDLMSQFQRYQGQTLRQQGQAQGIVFAVQRDQSGDKVVVEGTLLVFHTPHRVLFNIPLGLEPIML
ncbi:hypothetical protein GIB67_030225 [Kingdonia uniflora]|uniref:Uncharacterized protein n=1 Tax=Kingdonia uniflora TaxID=39325 RepID=A0A7J7MN78_9MAGN|nr:hypothetical protein GIB67_030225 [Kingdonia uniflora]